LRAAEAVGQQSGAQFRESLASLSDIGRPHAERLHQGAVFAVVDDRQRSTPDTLTKDTALLELVGQDQPKARMVFVCRIGGRRLL